MDAIIIDGNDCRSGAVCCIREVRNPILVARKVMEETNHILLASQGAEQFARLVGFPRYDPSTDERRKEWEATVDKLKRGESIPMLHYWSKIRKLMNHGTVGAVALDSRSQMAAGTSSGGFPLKMPGRVGDVPLFGCSTYAKNGVGGVSLSGQGEIIIRLLLAKHIVEDIEKTGKAQSSVEAAVRLVNSQFGSKTLLGGIALASNGDVGVAKNTELLPHAYMAEGLDKPHIGFGTVLR